jgi:hypothetical protein
VAQATQKMTPSFMRQFIDMGENNGVMVVKNCCLMWGKQWLTKLQHYHKTNDKLELSY